MSEPRTLASVVRVMRPDNAMPLDEKPKVIAALGELTVDDLNGMDLLALAERLAATDASLVVACDLPAICERLFKLTGQVTTVATPAAPSGPINVNVVPAQTLADTSVPGLLMLLRDDQDRYDDIVEELLSRRTIQAANDKTNGRWVIAPSGQIDIEATARYLRHLVQDGTVAQEEFDGVRPTTLDRAFGRTNRKYRHPFTGEALLGADRLGFDFMQLPEELHIALLWAAGSQHALWPSQFDRFAVSQEVFADPLPAGSRWARILEAYRAAKADGDDLATRMDRYAHEPFSGVRRIGPTGGGGAPFVLTGNQPAHNEAWYKSQLEAIAQAGIRAGHGDVHRSKAVVHYVQAGNGDITLDEVIVLRNVAAGSGDIYGTIYQPPGFQVSAGSGDLRAKVYSHLYKQLYERAKEWGLIA